MVMKRLSIALFALALASFNVWALEISADDQKWYDAVAKKIANGPAEISTPSETRVELLKAKVAEKGRKCEVSKTATGYRVAVK